MADTDKILDLDYTEQEFLQMMGFLQGKVKDFSPYISQPDDGYTYVFDTIENKNQFDRFFGINDEVAMQLVRYKWKNGVEKYMVINIEGEYVRNILLNSVGNVIKFDFYSAEGAGQRENEAGVVNVTITNDSGVKTMQQTFGLGSDKSINLDNYLVAGSNIVRISVTGIESKKVATTEVTYNVTEIDLSSDFNIAKIYGSGEIAKFNVKPKCNVQKYVEFWFDKETSMATQTSAIQPAENEVFVSLTLPTTSGKHILQMRCRADIDGKTCYSRTIYCEFVVRGEYVDFITIERKLHNSDIIQGEDAVTLHCEQYVQEDIPWAYIPFRQGTSPVITWKLEPTTEGDSTTLSTRVTDGTTTEEGTVYHLSFLPSVTGTFNLKALIDENEIGSYYTEIIKNTQGLEETLNGLRCKFSALGRSNSEPDDLRSTWKYNSYATEFSDVPWTNGCGWVDDALYMSGGAKATIGVRPFIDLRQSAMATTGATVEIDFETTNIKDENAVLLSIGERLKIKGNSAEFSSVSGVTLTDKFVANKRLKLAFIVHKSNTSLMEIINNGVSSRCASYGSSYFLDNNDIVIGGTDKASIKIYSIRIYETNLDTQQELRNVTIDASDIAAMVERNNIYTGGEVDISLIEDRIACLYVTGKGGSNKLSTIWNSTDKVQIYADVRWRNPNNPSSNWDCEAMRIRSHGQSTLANPLKSLKVWMKNDKNDNSFTTKFYPNGATEPSADPRWSMKPGAMPMNKFVFQCYYIDSSNCKSPAMLRMIDTAMKGADIITPPMRYVRDDYSKDMKAIHGSEYTFPYNIRMTPDSVPCVIVSRDSESEKWHYDGIFVLMDDKKSDYLYGERSIYSAIGDPYCFDVDKKAYQTLWDNKEVTRWEFLSNNHPISTFKDVSTFFDPPIDYTEDDDLPEDPNEVETIAEGGDSPDQSDTKAGYAFEQAIEIIYPDRDDLDDAKYMMRANKVKEFFDWVNGCYKVDNGGSQAVNKLWNEAPDHMEMEHWAAYYVIAMMNGAFDSLVRNMQLTTFDGQHWLPLWWDLDIQYGTINSGPLAFDPPVDRTTENNYGIAFRGSDNFLWNALETTIGFTTLCRDVLNKLTKASYNKESVIALQREYTDTWSEALYNESEDYKYKQMYLKNMSGNAKYLAYLLGDGNTFREWWMTKNYRYWESRLAGGSFTSVGVSWRYSDINHRFSLRVSYGEDTFFGWALGQQTQMIGDRYSVEVKAGEEKVVTLPQISQSDRLYFFNPQSIEMLDISDSVQALQDIALGNCYDESTGSMLKYLYLGVADAALEEGVRNTQVNDQISDLNKMNMLEILQMQGIIAPSVSYNINKANNIREVRMKGSSCAEMILPNSVTLDIAELPDTLQSISWDAVKFKEGALKFFDPVTLEESSFPHGAMTMEFKAMGNDPLIRQMIADWLEYKIQQNEIDGCKLSIQNIAWKGATYEEVLRLAKIDKNLRNYTGIIVMETALSSTQMHELETLLNDESKGIDVFKSDSAFQIDCNEGVSVSAPASLLSGSTYQLKTTVFPLFHKEQIVTYSIEGGTPSLGKWSLYNATLDQNTGLLTIAEDATGNYNLKINVAARTTITDDDGNEVTQDKATSATIQIIARQYPTSVSLQGVTSIEVHDPNVNYEINAVFEPSGTNGNIDTATWELGNVPDCIVNIKQYDKKLTYNTAYVDNSTKVFNIKYSVKFKNGRVLNGSVIVNIHQPETILTESSNLPVLEIMSFNGLTHNGYMTDLQAWNIRDEETGTYKAMPWNELKSNAARIRHFEEIRFFYYLTSVDFNGWYNIDTSTSNNRVEDYDFTHLESLTSLKMKGNVVSAKGLPRSLTTLWLGAPENVRVINCNKLQNANFTIQDVSRVKTIVINNSTYGYKKIVEIIKRKALGSIGGYNDYNANGEGTGYSYSVNAQLDEINPNKINLSLIETKTIKTLSGGTLVSSTTTKSYHARIVIIQDIDESHPETASMIDNFNESINIYVGWRDSYPNGQIKVRLYANDVEAENAERKWAEKTIKLNTL